MELELLVAALSSLMVMIPLWRITRRTGRDPWLSLLFLGTPPIGTLVFIAILAFGRWPAERGTGPADRKAGAADDVVPPAAAASDASDGR
ncbi:MAG: hypothetical protein EHM87_20195 [Burkholderiales bacterium]|nr:MAG: hypothetical protein EHM87_20195 [Burkholderiales bacterium]